MRFRDVKRAAREERGTALVMAIGVAMVLAIAGTSLIEYGISNEHAADRSKRSHDSYQLAVAGIENAVSQLANATAAQRGEYTLFSAMSPSAKTQTFDADETVTWAAVLKDDNPNAVGGAGSDYTGSPSDNYIPNLRWRLTSTSVVPAESGPGTITRTVTADVRLRPLTQQTRDEASWEYVYSWKTGDPDGCDMELPNNPQVTSSFYVAGNLCLDNNSSILGPTPGNPPVKVNVKGNAVLKKAGNDIGTVARRISQGWVDGVFAPGFPLGGCKYRVRGYDNPCTTASHFESSIPDPAPPINGPIIPVPTAQFDDWYYVASPGPAYPCDPALSSGTPPVFDNDTVMNASVPLQNLASFGSYTCKTLLGEISWNALTNKLTIDGTAFVDGNIEFDANIGIDYDGVGALWTSGYFRMHQTLLCGKLTGTNCDNTNWNPDTDLLFVATAGAQNFAQCPACGVLLEQAAQFQGALYAENNMGFQNNSEVQGPMVAKEEVIQNSFTFNYIPPLIRVPFGTPSNTIVGWDILPPTNFTG